MEKIFNRSVKIGGDYRIIDGAQVQVILTGTDDRILYAKGSAVPSAKSNYEKGCIFVKTGGGVDDTFYVNIGSATSCSFVAIENTSSTSYAVLEESKVYTAEVTLTTANLKALRATPIQVVAAPGAGKMLEFVSATLKYNYSTAALTESGCNLGFRYNDGSGLQVSETIEATG